MAKIVCPGCGAEVDTETGIAELPELPDPGEVAAGSDTPAESVVIVAELPAVAAKRPNRYRR